MPKHRPDLKLFIQRYKKENPKATSTVIMKQAVEEGFEVSSWEAIRKFIYRLKLEDAVNKVGQAGQKNKENINVT